MSEKFVDKVIGICDEEMIGEVAQLRIAHDAGLLQNYFKPVVRIGIERAFSAQDAPITTESASTPLDNLKSSYASGETVKVPLHLETEPYYDVANIPLNTYKNKAPLMASIISVKRIVGLNAPGEASWKPLCRSGLLNRPPGSDVLSYV